MRNYELKPTYNNLFSTYIEDSILRNKDLFYFIKILDTMNDSCSIALNGAWGSGKTFFVKQAKMILDAHNDSIESGCKAFRDRDRIKERWKKDSGQRMTDLQPQMCVYYDAWANDNDDDPVLSLIYSILQSIDSDYTWGENKSEKVFGIASTILEFFSGKDWGKLIQAFKKEDPLKTLKANKNIQGKIAEFFDCLLEERGKRLVIFIDELDRCKPDYAVKVLERIKHYFANDKITFVFSTNMNELQHTIKQFYGSGFDASNYLNHFFDLEIELPPVNMEEYFRYLTFEDKEHIFELVCGAVINRYFPSELRNIAKYLRLVKIAAHKPAHKKERVAFNDGQALRFGICYIIPIMIGLKICDTQRYGNFVHGQDYTPMIEITDYLGKMGSSYMKHILFSSDEVDDSSDIQEKKLKEIYDVLFAQKRADISSGKTIGRCEFENVMGTQLIQIASLCSEQADYALYSIENANI